METSNSLLKSLASSDYAILERSLRRVNHKSGTVLYEPEDQVEWVYFPEEGMISLISVMASGDQVESAVVGREGGVGFLEASGSGIIFSRAIVQMDLVAKRAPASAYVDALNASGTLRQTVASHVELTIAEGRQTIACQAHHPVHQRLAWWLLECQDRTGQDELHLTHEFLSAMLGVQRTTVTSIARKLKKSGLILYSRGHITILDRTGLLAASCECYETNQNFRRIIQGARAQLRRDPESLAG